MTRRPISVSFEHDCGDGLWATVEADVWPDDPGIRTGHPDRWTPPERGEVVLTSAVVLDPETEVELELVGAALEEWSRERWDELERAAQKEAEKWR